MQSITEIVKPFKQNWTEELNPENIATAYRDSGMTWIRSMLNPIVTMQIFFLQILNGNIACTDLRHLTRMSFTAAGYCRARMRIKLPVFHTFTSKMCGFHTASNTEDRSMTWSPSLYDRWLKFFDVRHTRIANLF